ncbi:STAS domain-containing protein [Trinickia dinghuensis]|uniref:STAS domain-containing protein n=1 Tax=Trinickia dinghuensis TaxID=2291023 RepID=UPI001FE9BDA0|nr:STAS domain-containing protein [Trinickia dinghuensis]
MFAIEGELTIYRAAELHAEFQRAVIGTGSFFLDLSAVTEFDSAGVQLLLAARRSVLAAGGEWRIAASSDAVREVLDTLGLYAGLADTGVSTGADTGADTETARASSAHC